MAAVIDVQIRVNGNAAVATMQLIAYNPDGTTQPPERQIRVFQKRNEQWQQLAAIGTPIKR